MVNIPLIGTVAAGEPILAEERDVYKRQYTACTEVTEPFLVDAILS